MELKPGFKQTDVGVIPKDWVPFELQNACERISVGLATSVTKYYRPSGVPIVRNLNIKDGFFDGRDMLYISQEFAKANVTKMARAFDVVTVRTGANLGDTCVLPAAFDKCQTFTTLITTPAPSLLNPHFLCLHMGSFIGKNEMSRLQVGSGKGNLNTSNLRRYRIGVPPLLEQEAIIGALRDADAIVESLEQLIAKKRHLKQGALQELLTGKKRLMGFSAEWKEATLGRMGKCYRGVSYNPGADLSGLDTDSTIRLLRSNNVQQNKVVFADMQFVDSDRVSDVQRLRIDDILICMANGSRELVGKAGRFSADDGFEYTFGAFMGCFRPDRQAADPDYVSYLFQTQKYRAHIAILLAGSSINNLRPRDLEALYIPIPSEKDEQTAIAAILCDMDAEIAALEAKLAKARQIKQGMMHNLLTGKIRLV